MEISDDQIDECRLVVRKGDGANHDDCLSTESKRFGTDPVTHFYFVIIGFSYPIFPVFL
jgi:hypothetical protein